MKKYKQKQNKKQTIRQSQLAKSQTFYFPGNLTEIESIILNNESL